MIGTEKSDKNYMSDIPLRKLRRYKNRGDYTPLDDPGAAESGSRIALHSPNPASMTRTTTISTTANMNRGAGRSRRYVDDPEEEAGLLSGIEDGEEEERRSPVRVFAVSKGTDR